MPKEPGPHIQNTIEKSGKLCRIEIARPQQPQQGRRRFDFVSFHVLGDVRRQSAVGTIEQNAGLTLDEQAQFGKFVLEYGDTGSNSMHKSFPRRRGPLSRRLGRERFSVLSSQFSVLSSQFSVLSSQFSVPISDSISEPGQITRSSSLV